MNIFLEPTPNKFFIFKTSDFKFDINALREAVNSLYKASSLYSDYIITGCTLTQSGTDVILSEGSIFTTGEYFKVDAKSFPNTSVSTIQSYYFDLVESYDPNGAITYLDSTAGNLRKIRKATLIASPTTFVGLQFSAMKGINSDLVDLIPDATIIQKGKIQIADENDLIAGTNTTKCITPKQLIDRLSTISQVIPIGNWNMDMDYEKVVPISIDINKVVAVDVVIMVDGGTYLQKLNRTIQVFGPNYGLAGNIANITSSAITLHRTDGGFFDQSLYSSTSINRGYIKIDKLP